MRDFKALALKHSVSCFFNSLFREFSGFEFLSTKDLIPGTNESISVRVSDKNTLLIPLTKRSLLGRHEYQDRFFILRDGGVTEISFLESVDFMAGFLCEVWKEDPSKKNIFLKRVQNSLQNIEISLKARYSDIERLYSSSVSFKDAEQGLMIGHNFHPYPKMREGFDDKDFETYSPEMAGHFGLHWFFVKPEVLHNQTAAQFKETSWTKNIYVTESSAEIPEGFVAFPVHPWQRQHLLKNKAIKQYLTDGRVIDAGAHSLPWYPTSSLRSVYAPHSPYMLKFSLTVRLTNSVRHLTDVEVVRGLQVYDVFATDKGQEFQTRFPEFEVIFEPAFAALKDENGKIISESIVVCRENPFQAEKPGAQNIVLSTLAQDNPLGGDTLILKHVKEYVAESGQSLKSASSAWFKKFMKVALQPMVTAQSEYGILLGAHQQNMILSIQNHLPVKTYFRDCQGTGYSEHGFELFHKDVVSLVRENGNILDEKGNILFAYYLVVNSAFNVISALADTEGVSELELVHDMREFIKNLKTTKTADESFLNYVLLRAEIYQKGNFNCSLQNLNENTAANPLAIYNLIKNPLFLETGKSL